MNELTTLIASLKDSPAETILWRDVFCHECDANENINGTAQQLAEKIIGLGWVIDNPEHGNLNCAKCAETRPETNLFWLEAQERYDRWKGERCEA